MRNTLILLALLYSAAVGLAARQGPRIVDSVDLSVARDEAAHACAGERTDTGRAAGRTWRSAAGWFACTLRTYDDSPLTLVFVLAAGSGERDTFDILVDGTRAATIDRAADRQEPGEIRVDVPFDRTKGKLSVTVKIQARDGARTARVLEIRTVQEHLE